MLAIQYGYDDNWSKNLFSYYLKNNIWTQLMFPKESENSFHQNWFFVPILGQLHLLLPKSTLKYDLETSTWEKTDPLLDLPVENIRFLRKTYS